MSDSSEPIFISYAGPDKEWAEWVAWHLQENGYRVELDRWHWRTGDDFVTKMSEALAQASAVVAVFSPRYFEAGRYTEEEWTSAIARRGRYVPLVVEPLEDGQLPAILAPRLRKDLHGLSEPDALKALLDAVRGPARPTRPPAFPGAAATPSAPPAPQGPQPPFPPRTGGGPAVWDVRDRRRNPHFTGREAVIDEVRGKLLAERHAAVQALRGTGGIGKTLVALEYAFRHAADYDLVWWVDAEQSEQVVARYAELAARVDVAKPEAGVEFNARYAMEYLRTRDRWLIILDNAEDPEQLRSWLPEGGGHVLITARNPAWSGIVPGLSLGVFSREESVAYLRGQLPALTDDQADALAEALGDLPLALAQAAGVMRGGIPADRYLELLRTNTAQLLGRSNLPDYPASLAATVTIAAERLEADHPGAVAVLRLAAFLGPEPIPTSWLVTARDSLASVPGDAEDIFWPESALTPLGRYGLAVVGSDVFQVHRLTQAVVREACSEAADSLQDDVAALLVAVEPGDPELPATWPLWASLAPHVSAALSSLSTRADARPTLLNIARYLVRSAQPHAAHSLAGTLHETWSELLGKDDPDTLRAAHMVTWGLDALAAHAEALPLVEDILERRRRVLGEDDDDTLSSAYDLAVTLSHLGRFEESYALHQKVHERRRAILGDDHPETLRAAYALAADLNLSGSPERAYAPLAEILELQRRSLGNDHLSTLDTAHELANVLYKLSRLHEAHLLVTDVLDRRRNVLGEDHPGTLRAYRGFGAVLTRLGRHDEARSVLADTLERQRRTLGSDHPDSLHTADSLGGTLNNLGRYAEAEQVLRDTRPRVQRTMGKGRRLYTMVTHNLAFALEGRGRKFEAQKLRASLPRKST
ncbi:FxSxx-COOH system tetratricopeptide repeat protein [Streptomyces sp. NBC_00124]|uniref:FxSxx-COOH system tetratricopeptide repeat protein n=1 Tax=Streptomyces sp. NBC_00124 TaxID=2975662 RepID=UPI00225694B1|nr:FxSxx-COOH system tetratricopeptide repeat protein [Streptomyces sp. NBC_00124]MCX5362600.1 FxSxx-COOH system tetratricopeptide repeat protein [Streptomyces sp. NBC_00124]